MKDNLTGNLLVASSIASDPMYAGAVCLVVHQDESNAIGVFVNRPMQPSPEALLQMLGSAGAGLEPATEAGGAGAPAEGSVNRVGGHFEPSPTKPGPQPPTLGMLHFGGPRSGPVVAIHQTSQYAEAETGPGIYVAATKEHLQDLVREHPAPYRLIVGHLGWETPELQQEIDGGLWHTIPATAETVFSSTNDMWPRLIRRATSNSVARWIGVPNVYGAGELN